MKLQLKMLSLKEASVEQMREYLQMANLEPVLTKDNTISELREAIKKSGANNIPIYSDQGSEAGMLDYFKSPDDPELQPLLKQPMSNDNERWVYAYMLNDPEVTKGPGSFDLMLNTNIYRILRNKPICFPEGLLRRILNMRIFSIIQKENNTSRYETDFESYHPLILNENATVPVTIDHKPLRYIAFDGLYQHGTPSPEALVEKGGYIVVDGKP